MKVPTDFEQSAASLLTLADERWAASTPFHHLPEVNAIPAPEARVLVTGGAGFLGVHLLAEMARRWPRAQLLALVRDPLKLPRQWARYGLDPALLPRVTAVTGDLNDMAADELPQADVVVHSAARIHALKNLSAMWRDNVEATARVLNVYRQRGARLLLISTLSVFVSSNRTGLHKAVPVAADPATMLKGGYAQSKLVAERLAHLVDADIVRLGLLTASSSSGVFPAGDFFSTVLQRLCAMGVHPCQHEPAWVDVTPVDCAAARIVQMLQRPSKRPRIRHIANPLPLSLGDFLRECGTQPVPVPEFKERLKTLPRLEQLLLTYAFFKPLALDQYPAYFNVDLFQTTGHQYDVTKGFGPSPQDWLAHYACTARASNTNNAQ